MHFVTQRRLRIFSYCMSGGNRRAMRRLLTDSSKLDPDLAFIVTAEFYLAPPRASGSDATAVRADSAWKFAGCEWEYRSVVRPQYRVSATAISIPWWMLMVVSLPGAAGLAHLVYRRRHLRRNPTLCRTCGYDLRAGHDRCPECGGVSHVTAATAAE